MDEKTADVLASVMGGESWQSGGGVYVVSVTRDDGSVVVFSDEAICEYESDEAFDEGRAAKMIQLQIPDTDDLFVVVDEAGNIFYRDDALERGWRYEEEAEQEARGLESKGEGRFQVVRQCDV